MSHVPPVVSVQLDDRWQQRARPKMMVGGYLFDMAIELPDFLLGLAMTRSCLSSLFSLLGLPTAFPLNFNEALNSVLLDFASTTRTTLAILVGITNQGILAARRKTWRSLIRVVADRNPKPGRVPNVASPKLKRPFLVAATTLTVYCLLTMFQAYAQNFVLELLEGFSTSIFDAMIYGVTLDISMSSMELLQGIKYELLISALPLMQLAVNEVE